MTDAAPATGTTTDTGASTTEAATPAPATTEATAAAPTQQPATEAQTPAGDNPAVEAASETPSAPEKYEFALPEGKGMDTEVLGELEQIAKKANLPQAEAQKLVDLGLKLSDKWATQQAEQLKAAGEQWIADTKADKEFGGAKFNENMAVAHKAIDAFGTPELRTLLNESGLGNHPEIIRAFYRAGKAISEDRLVPAGTGNVLAPKEASKALYPNQP